MSSKSDIPQSANLDECSRSLRRLLEKNKLQRVAAPQGPDDFIDEWLTGSDIKELIEAGCLDSIANEQDENSFRLTPRGLRLCVDVLRAYHQTQGAPAVPVPCWDRSTKLLTLDDKIIKRFRRTATNQERLLNRFQELSWPERIDCPLPIDLEIVPSDRLKETIKRLNNSMDDPLIRFRGDGTGRGVQWSLRTK